METAIELSGSDILAVLADPTRRAVFEALHKSPMPVGQLAEQFSVSRPAISQHLKTLKNAGLVVDHAEGTRRIYRTDVAGLMPLRSWLDQFWSEALAAYANEVNRQQNEEKAK